MTSILAIPALLILIFLNRPPWEHGMLFSALVLFELIKRDSSRLTLVRISIFSAIAIANFISESGQTSLFYPVFMNGLVSYFFIESFFKEETLIEKFAKKHEKNFTEPIRKYCFKLNIYWSILMPALTIISLYTAIKMDKELWLLWNGLISYLIIGGSIIGEFLYRQIHKKKLAKLALISSSLALFISQNIQAQTCPPKPKDQKLTFTELRYIPHISQPVKVTGYLDIHDQNNYTWETDGEYASKIEQRPDSTTFYKKEEGEWVKTETNEFLDIFLEINSAINGNVKKNDAKLKSECKIEKDGTWVLTLNPIDGGLEIDSIKIEGKENPVKFSMEMKNGFKSFVSYH